MGSSFRTPNSLRASLRPHFPFPQPTGVPSTSAHTRLRRLFAVPHEDVAAAATRFVPTAHRGERDHRYFEARFINFKGAYLA